MQANADSISLWKLIIAPSEEFLKMRSITSIWRPLIAFTLIQTIMYFLLGFTSPQLLKQLHLGLDTPLLAGVIFAIFGLFTVPTTILISSLVQKWIAYFLKERLSYEKLLLLNVYLWMIILLKNAFILISVLYLGGDFAVPQTSLAALLVVEGPAQKLLSMIELFSLWHFALVAIGLKQIFQLSAKKAWTIALEAFFAEATIILLLG